MSSEKQTPLNPPMSSQKEAPLTATCHCGAITVTVPKVPTYVNECQCTVCRRYGAAWAYYTTKSIIITTELDTPAPLKYIWGDRDHSFNFCGKCGCVMYWYPAEMVETKERPRREDGGFKVGVNTRMMDQDRLRFVNRLVDYEAALTPIGPQADAHPEDKAVYGGQMCS